MLDVTLLSVEHAGEEEAKKVLPYIQDCDVVSVESPFETEKGAIKSEKEWNSLLNLTRTKFNKQRREVYRKNGKDVIDYWVKVEDYLFRSRLPLWHIERWENPNKAEEGVIEERNITRMLYQSLGCLTREDLNYYFERSRESLWLNTNLHKERDKNMGENLNGAESIIRKTYDHLRGKETIRLVSIMGAGHNPQKFTDMSVKRVDLTEYVPSFVLIQMKLYDVEDRKDYSKRDLLAWGVGSLAEENGEDIDDERIEVAGIDELKEMLDGLMG
tara:strand:+ start:1391 stop:2206 length:816 start_codon:yes stop_codon:yes gene_type:complete